MIHRAYHDFIMGRRPHSWLVAAYAPTIAVRGYWCVWAMLRHRRNPWIDPPPWTVRSAHRQAWSNATARFMLAWNGTPTCQLPLPGWWMLAKETG